MIFCYLIKVLQARKQLDVYVCFFHEDNAIVLHLASLFLFHFKSYLCDHFLFLFANDALFVSHNVFEKAFSCIANCITTYVVVQATQTIKQANFLVVVFCATPSPNQKTYHFHVKKKKVRFSSNFYGSLQSV